MSDTALKIVTTARELFDCLIEYMGRRGPTRTYNQAVVDFIEYLIKEIPQNLDDAFLREDLGVEESPLTAVFEKTGLTQQVREYSSSLVTFAARLYEEVYRDPVCLEQANRLAICILNRAASDKSTRMIIREEERGDDWWLISTEFFESEVGVRVELKQNKEYARYLRAY
jgi:hypothetical protein